MTVTEGLCFVLDSSALAKVLVDEPESRSFTAWLRDALARGTPLVSPSLVAYELGEIIRRQRGGSAGSKARTLVAATRLARLVSHDPLLEGAFGEAPRLTFYDACFLGLARIVSGTLVTYDRRLVEMAERVDVATLSP